MCWAFFFLQEDASAADSVAFASATFDISTSRATDQRSLNKGRFVVDNSAAVFSHTIPYTPHPHSAESCEEAGVVVLAAGCI